MASARCGLRLRRSSSTNDAQGRLRDANPRGIAFAPSRAQPGSRSLPEPPKHKLAHVDLRSMFLVIVVEGDGALRLLDAIARDALDRPTTAAEMPDVDPIDRLAVPVLHIEPRPARWQEGVTRRRSTSSRSPRSDSVIRRYIQPADPVYQVQPPRPACC